MSDSGAVGGVRRSGDRYGRPADGGDKGRSGSGPAPERTAPPPQDEVLLHSAEAAAWPLLRERVLAASRALLGQPAPPGPPRAGADPEDPVAALLAIQAEQRRLCGPRAHEPGLQERLDAAFRCGLDEAAAVLADVGRLAPDVAAWFAAVGRALAERAARPPDA